VAKSEVHEESKDLVTNELTYGGQNRQSPPGRGPVVKGPQKKTNTKVKTGKRGKEMRGGKRSGTRGGGENKQSITSMKARKVR